MSGPIDHHCPECPSLPGQPCVMWPRDLSRNRSVLLGIGVFHDGRVRRFEAAKVRRERGL